MKKRNVIVGLLLAIVTMAGALVATAAPASAAFVNGCTRGVCVIVMTGPKANGMERIDSIIVMPNSDTVFTEVWGDGIYYTGKGRIEIYPDRWVHAGTNICGAATYPGSPRKIACIHIS